MVWAIIIAFTILTYSYYAGAKYKRNGSSDDLIGLACYDYWVARGLLSPRPTQKDLAEKALGCKPQQHFDQKITYKMARGKVACKTRNKWEK